MKMGVAGQAGNMIREFVQYAKLRILYFPLEMRIRLRNLVFKHRLPVTELIEWNEAFSHCGIRGARHARRFIDGMESICNHHPLEAVFFLALRVNNPTISEQERQADHNKIRDFLRHSNHIGSPIRIYAERQVGWWQERQPKPEKTPVSVSHEPIHELEEAAAK